MDCSTYDIDFMLDFYPDIRSAQVGVERAQFVLRKAKAEPIPNVELAAGYTRDNIDRQIEWTFQVGVPVPVFNRNQGNIQAAGRNWAVPFNRFAGWRMTT